MLTWLAALMTVAGVVLAALAAYVGWRRGSRAGIALAVLLAAVAWWGVAYALELAAVETATKSQWGDLKYLGVSILAPRGWSSCCSTPTADDWSRSAWSRSWASSRRW